MENRSIIQNNVKFSSQKVLQIKKILNDIEAHSFHIDEMIKNAIIENRLNIQLSEYENQKKALLDELEFDFKEDKIYNDIKELKAINNDTDNYERSKNRHAYKIDTIPKDIDQSIYSECKIIATPKMQIVTDRPISLPTDNHLKQPPQIPQIQQPAPLRPSSTQLTPRQPNSSSVKLSGRKLSSNTEVNIRAPSPSILQDYLKRESQKTTNSGKAFKRLSTDILNERKQSINESTKIPLTSTVIERNNSASSAVTSSSFANKVQMPTTSILEEQEQQSVVRPVGEIHPYHMAKLEPINSNITGPSPPPHEPTSTTNGRRSRTGSRPRPRIGSNQILRDASEEEEKVSSKINGLVVAASDPYSVNNNSNEDSSFAKPFKLPPLPETKE